MPIYNTYKISSPDTGKLIDEAIALAMSNAGDSRVKADQDAIHLENIRLLAHVRRQKTGMALRERFIWSMRNLLLQMKNDELAMKAFLIIQIEKGYLS